MSEEHFSKLDAFFNPKSIAVVGASTKPHTVGNDLLRNLIFHEYNGSVYPINPKAQSVLGIHAYPSLKDIPTPVDLIVVAVPAAAVLDVVKQAPDMGVKAMVLISAGFKESGNEGMALEQKLRSAVRDAGIALIGPNCLGIINSENSLNTTVMPWTTGPGLLGFASQSGTYVTQVLPYLRKKGIRSAL